MLPFSVALRKAGGVPRAADGLMALLTASAGAQGVLSSLFATTALLGLFISKTATVVLMASVSLAIARDPSAMIVDLAASTAFMTQPLRRSTPSSLPPATTPPSTS